MTVRVREIAIESRGVTALVIATSQERFGDKPVARIQISLRLPALEGESPRDARERVRDEALRFLDIE